MKRFFSAASLAVVATTGFGAERVYTPTAPAGSNLAAIASPRDDWFAGVQAKFDKYGDKPADIVFDGDSITNRWESTGRAEWNAHYAGHAADFGIEGDRTENVLWRLSKGQVDGVNPRVVVLMIGTNNTGRDSVENLAAGVNACAAEYLKRCPQAHLILMAIFPRSAKPNDPARIKVKKVNEIISHVQDPQRETFIDIGPQLEQPDGTILPTIMPDFVHPNAPGYRIWATAIRPTIDKYLQAK